MLIKQSYIDELSENIKISDVVEAAGIKLKKQGKEKVGLCGFHDEKTPSMFINEEKNCFNCHGCKAGGNALHFIKEFWNLAHFPDVIAKAVEISGFRPIEYQDSNDSQADKTIPIIRSAHKYLTEVFRGVLPSSRPAIEYLRERGITPQDIMKWELGFSPEDDWYFSANSSKGKFSISHLVTAGIQIRNENTGKTHDRFRGRIIFPIKSANGGTIAFAGRQLPVINNESSKGPKYINSPETPIFKKSQTLFGLNHALSSDNPEPGAINVVEGYMDVIGCHREGFTNTVGSMGTALGKESAETLFKRFDKIRLIFDGDQAGKGAAMRALNYILPHVSGAKRVTICTIQGGLDPDELIQQQGSSAFQRLLQAEQPASLFIKNFYREQLGGINTPEDHAEVLHNAQALIELITDEICKETMRADLFAELHQGLTNEQRLTLMSDDARVMLRAASPESIKLAGNLLTDSSWLTLANSDFEDKLEPNDQRVINYAIRVHNYCAEHDLKPDEAFINTNQYLIDYILAHANPKVSDVINTINSLSQISTKDKSHALSSSLS